MERPFSPPEDSPLPDIPAINFDPPLSIQRQAVIHTFLRLLASTPRFAGTITKLLDAGCGDATFIRRLIPCDDALPLRHMTGVDIDEEAANSQSWSLLKQPVGDEDGRWHELDIRLLHGSFEALRTEGVGYHEVVVSVEVIEHLDPVPLSNFAPTLLGRLKPKVCIVTTPSREFNALFDYLEDLRPDKSGSEGFRRDGIPYRMRHHDHRFEWTRQEFRSWALQAAEEFGYDVQFSGVGGLGRGMVVVGKENADDVLREAAAACGSPESLLKGTDKWGELERIVCEVDDDERVSIVRTAFGDCTQIAVFVLRPQEEPSKNLDAPHAACGDGLKLMHHHSYRYIAPEEFPPSIATTLGLLMGDRLSHLIPELIREEWTRDDDEAYKDILFRRKYGDSFNPRGNVWNKEVWRNVDDEALRKTEWLFARTGGRVWEVKCVEVVVDALKMWEGSSKMRRAFHFRPEVFADVMRNVKAGEETPQALIENAKMEVILSKEGDKTVVTATFPASRRPIPKDPWEKPEVLERVLFCEDDDDYGSYEEIDEFDDEFDEFEYADEADVLDDEDAASFGDGTNGIFLPEPQNPKFRLPSLVKRPRPRSPSPPTESVTVDHPGEFDTVIEWIAHSEGLRPENCLPGSTELEGTLDITDGNPTGLLFRVKFLAPERKLPEIPADYAGLEEESMFEEDMMVGEGSWWEAELEVMPETELMPGHHDEVEGATTPA